MKAFLRENRALFLLLLLFMIFRTSYADWHPVPSGSMEPTLLPGDVVWVDKTRFGPTVPFLNRQLFNWGSPGRGDVITFIPPHTDVLYVKRVIGIPGDRIRIEGPRIYINDRLLEQQPTAIGETTMVGTEWIDGHAHAFQLTRGLKLPYIGRTLVIPSGKYFVMGDHRNNSEDSRYWGFVDQSQIMGKVTRIAVSFASERPWSDRMALPVE